MINCNRSRNTLHTVNIESLNLWYKMVASIERTRNHAGETDSQTTCGNRNRMPSSGSAHISTVLPKVGVTDVENVFFESEDSSNEIASGVVVELIPGGDVGIDRLAPLALAILVLVSSRLKSNRGECDGRVPHWCVLGVDPLAHGKHEVSKYDQKLEDVVRCLEQTRRGEQ